MTESIMFEGFILHNVHDWTACQTKVINGVITAAYRSCVIHRPSPHHMRLWQLTWRDDRGIFERICSHGTGHPDPDQFDYWKERGQEWQSVHGCDGCCREPQFTNPAFRRENPWGPARPVRLGPVTSTAPTASEEPNGGWEFAPAVVNDRGETWD